MIGLLLGTCLGLLELVPNAHPQILALTLLPWLGLGFLDNLLLVTSLLVTSLFMHSLGHTYHPIPRSLLASAEPAQKMAYEGLGWFATAIQSQAIPYGIGGAIVFVPLLVLLPVRAFLIPLTLALAGLAVWKTRNKLSALLVLGFACGVGQCAQSLGHAGMTPLLSGLFTLPPLLHLLMQGRSLPLPAQTAAAPGPVPAFAENDSLLGCVAALLPGISSSSMAHLRVNDQTAPWQYLSITAPQHAASAMAALLLLVLTGSPHSGLAVALFGTAPWMPMGYTLGVMILSVLFLIPVGFWLVQRLEAPYIRLVQAIPQKGLALLMLPVVIGLIGHHAGPYGLVLAGAACSVSLLQKALHVPNQILLQALTIPLVATLA